MICAKIRPSMRLLHYRAEHCLSVLRQFGNNFYVLTQYRLLTIRVLAVREGLLALPLRPTVCYWMVTTQDWRTGAAGGSGAALNTWLLYSRTAAQNLV